MVSQESEERALNAKSKLVTECSELTEKAASLRWLARPAVQVKDLEFERMKQRSKTALERKKLLEQVRRACSAGG